MSSVLRGIWDNTYGLLVDDGQLAIGAIAALVVTWLAAQSAALQENAGWLLLVLVLGLVIANLYRAGRNARSRVSS
jgi:phosphate/sulfate permease